MDKHRDAFIHRALSGVEKERRSHCRSVLNANGRKFNKYCRGKKKTVWNIYGCARCGNYISIILRHSIISMQIRSS